MYIKTILECDLILQKRHWNMFCSNDYVIISTAFWIEQSEKQNMFNPAGLTECQTLESFNTIGFI